MTRFHSRHYPRSRNALLVSQEYAMQYYGAFNLLIMTAVIAKVYTGGGGSALIWAVVIAEVVALVLGNLLAYGSLRRRYAEVYFVEKQFSLISVYDILYEQQAEVFPLPYANPTLSGDRDRLTLHFTDQVVTLKREDWEDFDTIIGWMQSGQL